MQSEYGVIRLVKEATREQWVEGWYWLGYTLLGVGIPLGLAWVAHLNQGELLGFLDLIDRGELFIYSASFWVYTTFAFDRARLGPGYSRLLAIACLLFVGVAYTFLQAKPDFGEFNTAVALRASMLYVSIAVFGLSIGFCFMGNLVAQSKAFLQEKANVDETLELKKVNMSALAEEVQGLEGED